ncbi:hypothetical protein BU15DRAFT_78124 [Melanogaster broomeanus]|nr:hypothetical protein BU15DRAFT_78124 [Melanogaster broomeanus]
MADIAESSIQVFDFVPSRMSSSNLSNMNKKGIDRNRKHISADAELWTTGNDDDTGIGDLGLASCTTTESPEYKVFSLIFEDRSLDEAARENAVQSPSQSPPA